MRKRTKLLILGLVFFGGLIITGMVVNQELPQGEKGPKAEALADEMLAAINIDAWNELKWLQWEFPGGHKYLWDKQRNLVEVKWGKKVVLLNPEIQQGKVYVKGAEVQGKDAEKLLKKANRFFTNDAFWLLAYTKVKDPGTERSFVELEDGARGLLVTYTSGGMTPGDSYLWILDDNGRPLAWQMWVKVLPIGGLKTGWNEWQELYNGAMVAPLRKAMFTLELKNIKADADFGALGIDEDPFQSL